MKNSQHQPTYPILARLAIIMPLVLASLVLAVWARSSDNPLDDSSTPSSAAIAKPLGALTIPAMRQRTYRPSTLTPLPNTQQTHPGFTTEIAWYNSDGYKVNTLVATPDGPPPALGYPTVIVAHGFTNPSEYFATGPEYRDVIDELASHGYLVVKPDYRGYGHSGGIATSGFYTPADVYDLLNLTATLKHDPVVSANNIGLWAHSMGAQIGLRALVSKPGAVKAAALAAGPNTTPEELYAQSYPAVTSREISPDALQSLIQQHGPPSNINPFWYQTAAVNYVSDIKTNLLLLQDADDPVVFASFTDDLDERLRADHKIVTYDRYPFGGHNFAGATHERMLSDTLGFFDRNLKTPTLPVPRTDK